MTVGTAGNAGQSIAGAHAVNALGVTGGLVLMTDAAVYRQRPHIIIRVRRPEVAMAGNTGICAVRGCPKASLIDEQRSNHPRLVRDGQRTV
jgi:hypothetical protein